MTHEAQDRSGNHRTPRVIIEARLRELDSAVDALRGSIEAVASETSPDRISALRERYRDVRREADLLREDALAAADTVQNVRARAQATLSAAHETVTRAYGDLRAMAKDEGYSDAVKKSAQNVGAGFASAWTELSGAVGKAYGRVRRDHAQHDARAPSKEGQAGSAQREDADPSDHDDGARAGRSRDSSTER